MPVKVRCTNCEKVLTAPDAARGKAIKCPGCQERVAVPGEDSSSGVSKVTGKSKTKAAKPARPADSEETITSLDLRKAEDANARVCSKCGYDMQYEDEEESECPKCGFDSAAGGMGKKATKRAMKGPDPADFYPGLAKGAWKFVLKNKSLAWRTDAYVAICLLISLFCGFMYLWISAWPPRVFFILCFTVAFMVIPGWLWLLDIEVIQLTLERKDKFKRFNFDFFLASAMGLMFVAWSVAVALPLMAIPLGVGYYLMTQSGLPPWIIAVSAGVGAIPALWMLPISMSHMAMPVSLPGWMVWKVVPTWTKTIAPLSLWMMWLFVSTLPVTGAAAVVGGVWGNDISNIVSTMEANAKTARARLAAENAPKGKNAAPPPDPSTIGEIVDVNFKPLIGPVIILLLSALPVGFIGLFNMRINGQFTYFNKTRLNMIDKRKEYKYIAKTKVDEDGEVIEDRSGKELKMGIGVALFGVAVCGGAIYELFLKGTPPPVEGGIAAYNAGRVAGVWTGAVFGLLMVVAGAFSIKKGMDGKKP